MRIATVRLVAYRLPLRRPWVAAAVTLHERCGMLLAVTADDGITGWGDCAPLPSSGAGGHERAFAALARLARRLPGRDGAALLADCAAGELPELNLPEPRWALETALCDNAARRQGVSLARFLDAGETTAVAVNAALGALDEACGARAAAAVTQGFALGKLKVGVLGVDGVDEELARLHALHARIDGRLRLRLDANRAWSDAAARRFLTGIADLPIDAVEEPLADPTVARLAALQADQPFAIAVDESLPLLGADALLDAGAVRRLVVKPARLGGIAATGKLAQRARQAGVEIVLTSVVDSAIGVTAAAHLAAAVSPGLAHGFGTLAWLARDVAPTSPLIGGQWLLGAAPGLGLIPVGEFA